MSNHCIAWRIFCVSVCLCTDPNEGTITSGMYSYIALQNNKTGQGPLASYFKGEVLHGRDTDMFTSNMCKLIFSYSKKTHINVHNVLDLAEDVCPSCTLRHSSLTLKVAHFVF
jgi:hypothetical protein